MQENGSCLGEQRRQCSEPDDLGADGWTGERVYGSAELHLRFAEPLEAGDGEHYSERRHGGAVVAAFSGEEILRFYLTFVDQHNYFRL
jgi:hypothetical protein